MKEQGDLLSSYVSDRVRTERPVGSEQSIDLFTQREEIDIDFRVSGLPHVVAKQAENFRVRELAKKIESHPHREALQADVQQNSVHNPFSDNAKAMIREMGNAESFESCKKNPKVQCSESFLYWNQGVIYCICGHLMRKSASSPKLHQWRLDVHSIQNSIIKKGRPRGVRHGKTEAQKEHFVNARRGCLKKKFEGINDLFQRESTYCDSQLKIGWTEEKSIEMDKSAQETRSYCPSFEEFERISEKMANQEEMHR